MKIENKDRLIPKIIIATGLLISIATTGISLGINSTRNKAIDKRDNVADTKTEMLDTFQQSDEFESLYKIHEDVLNEQHSSEVINNKIYNREIEYLNSSEFVESVLNASTNEEVIKNLRNLNAEYENLDNYVNKLQRRIDFTLLTGIISACATMFYVHYKKGLLKNDYIKEILDKKIPTTTTKNEKPAIHEEEVEKYCYPDEKLEGIEIDTTDPLTK